MAFWNVKFAGHGDENKSKSGDDSPKFSAVGETSSQITSKTKIIPNFAPMVEHPFPAGTRISGSVTFDKPIQVDGSFSGDLFSLSSVSVKSDAVLDGNIEADTFEICGKVKGQLLAKNKVVLCQGAVVDATIEAPSLEMQAGAKVCGTLKVGTGCCNV